MQYRLLSDDSEVSLIDAEWFGGAEFITVAPAISSVSPASHQAPIDEIPAVAMIEFASVGDGRGFSLAAELKEHNDFTRPLYACGKLIPDQLTLAFQCGFDGVVLDQHSWELYGESAWLHALKPTVDKGYVQSKWSAIDSIWQRRQVGLAGHLSV